jgi:hypothetical protein
MTQWPIESFWSCSSKTSYGKLRKTDPLLRLQEFPGSHKLIRGLPNKNVADGWQGILDMTIQTPCGLHFNAQPAATSFTAVFTVLYTDINWVQPTIIREGC